MVKVFKFLGTTVLAILLLVMILPYFISLNAYKAEIQSKVKEMTGRDLALNGDIKFRVLPSPYLKFSDVKLGSIEGTKSTNLVSVSSVEVKLSALPLLLGTISINEVRLKRPEVNLEKMKNGQVNWNLDYKSKDENGTKPENSTADASDLKLYVEHVVIREGVIIYLEDEEVTEVSDINLDVQFKSLSGPFDIAAKLKALGQDFEFQGRLQGVEGIVPIEMSIKVLGKTGTLTGSFDFDKFSYDAKLVLEGRLTDLKSMIPNLVVPDHLKKTYVLKSSVKGDLETLAIEKLRFELGPIQANGAATIDLKKKIGGLKLKIIPGEIDFDIKPTSTNPKNLRASVSLTSKDTRQFLQALNISVKDIPHYLLQAFSLKANVLLKENEVTFSQLDLDAGKARLNGEFTAANFGQEQPNYKFDLRSSNFAALAVMMGVQVPEQIGAVKVSGSATGTPDDLALELDILAANAKTIVNGQIVLAEKTMRPTLRFKSNGKNLQSTLQSLGIDDIKQNLGKFSIDILITGDYPQRVKMKIDECAFDLNRDNVAVSGDVDAFLGRVKPRFSANLKLSAMNLDRLLAGLNGQNLQNVSSKVPTPKKPKSRWSHEKIDLDFLRAFDGDIAISMLELKKGSLVFDSIQSTMRVANGVMDVTSLTGNLYGGKLDVKARISSQKGQPIALTAQLKNAQLKNITPQGTAIKVTKGDFSLDADLTTSGNSEYQFVSNLAGALNFRGSEGEISGFNLSGVVDQLQKLNSAGALLPFLDSRFTGGTSAFKSITAVSTISKGIMKLTKFELDAIRAKITAEGTVSLPNYAMAINARVALLAKDLPPFDVRFYGSLDAPKHDIQADALKAHLVKTVLTGIVDTIQKGDKSPESVIKGILGFGGGGTEKETVNPSANKKSQTEQPQQQQHNQEKQYADPVEKIADGLLRQLF